MMRRLAEEEQLDHRKTERRWVQLLWSLGEGSFVNKGFFPGIINLLLQLMSLKKVVPIL